MMLLLMTTHVDRCAPSMKIEEYFLHNIINAKFRGPLRAGYKEYLQQSSKVSCCSTFVDHCYAEFSTSRSSYAFINVNLGPLHQL